VRLPPLSKCVLGSGFHVVQLLTFGAKHRLQKNGIIKTENPMRAMQQEGRFEELSDDDSS
jgi:hypothetical protein